MLVTLECWTQKTKDGVEDWESLMVHVEHLCLVGASVSIRHINAGGILGLSFLLQSSYIIQALRFGNLYAGPKNAGS